MIVDPTRYIEVCCFVLTGSRVCVRVPDVTNNRHQRVVVMVVNSREPRSG
jgi:hypothetical protein